LGLPYRLTPGPDPQFTIDQMQDDFVAYIHAELFSELGRYDDPAAFSQLCV